MINYNFLSKFVHQTALALLPVREAAFSVEQLFLNSDNNTLNGEHVYIIGMARGGTTALLNTLYETGDLASLTYEDMPFILAPNIWSRIRPVEKETASRTRYHDDGLSISLKSPEAFEEIFWKTFSGEEDDITELYPRFLHAVLHRYKKVRYLCKNNQNIRRMEYLYSVLPNSKFLVIFRNPMNHCQSLLGQHNHFVALEKREPFIKKYMSWIGHSEFGPTYIPIYSDSLKFPDVLDLNHWLEQWLHAYESVFRNFRRHENVLFLCYESLNPSSHTWIELEKILNISGLGKSFKVTNTPKPCSVHPGLLNSCKNLYDEMKEAGLK